MTSASAVLASLGVTAALAGAGTFLLGRRPRAHEEWNEAFLCGGGAASVLLFPLSAAFPGGALWILAAGILAACAGAVRLRGGRPGRRLPGRGGAIPALRELRPVDALLLCALALSIVAFLYANGRYQLLWDGVFIWATKGMLLLDSGGLTRELWDSPSRGSSPLSFP